MHGASKRSSARRASCRLNSPTSEHLQKSTHCRSSKKKSLSLLKMPPRILKDLLCQKNTEKFSANFLHTALRGRNEEGAAGDDSFIVWRRLLGATAPPQGDSG